MALTHGPTAANSPSLPRWLPANVTSLVVLLMTVGQVFICKIALCSVCMGPWTLRWALLRNLHSWDHWKVSCGCVNHLYEEAVKIGDSPSFPSLVQIEDDTVMNDSGHVLCNNLSADSK